MLQATFCVHSANIRTSSNSMFDQFPVEIQYMIYNLVFIHVDAIKTCRARQISLQNEGLFLPSRTSVSRSELSLLAINRYIKSIILPFF